MLRFIFGKKDNTTTAKTETQRESFDRVMAELNLLLAEQPIKPSLGVDLETGQLVLDLPEQLADEALSLPAPKAEPSPAVAEAEIIAADEAKKDV
jgi:hypothetical protein